MKRILSIIIGTVILITCVNANAFALEKPKSYFDYIKQFANNDRNLEFSIKAVNFIKASSMTGLEKTNEYQGMKEVLKWNGDGNQLDWEIVVPEDGIYKVDLMYAPIYMQRLKIELSVLIDGANPFDESSKIILEKPWKDISNQKTFDLNNNQESNKQEMVNTWLTQSLHSNIFSVDSDLKFSLTKGKHIFSMESDVSDFYLDKITFSSADELKSYEEYRKEINDNTEGKDTIQIQAEEMSMRSDASLTGKYDRSDANVEPQSAFKMYYNIAGGPIWQTNGQWMEWDVDVKSAGNYNIVLKARQNYNNGMLVYRKLFIDGKVPFVEAEKISFSYESNWKNVVLQGQKPYLFYLSQGKHKIRLQVASGDYAIPAYRLQQVLVNLNAQYRQIVMITGLSPDANRDYGIEKSIPNLIDDLTKSQKELDSIINDIVNVTKLSSGNISTLKSVSAQLKFFYSLPEEIPQRLSNFKSNLDTIGVWLTGLQSQPLDLDYISVVPVKAKIKSASASFFSNLKFNLESLVASYFADYSSTNKTESDLTVWVSLGRDQLQILNQLTNDYYNKNKNYKVKINLVQVGVAEAILANSGPDAVFFNSSGEPVNLAMRGVIANLKNESGFDEVAKRFNPQSMVPFEYNGGYYGIPLTQSFPMLFCRTDILNQLDIKPPETWNELFKVIPQIKRRNMDVGIPLSSGTFFTFIFQNGGTVYDANKSKTELDSPLALNAFKTTNELFTDYSLPLAYDFFNRFKGGLMPIAIADYTEYNRLEVAAPEIKGLWAMYPVPGTVDKDGKMNRSVVGAGAGCMILQNSKNKEKAWDYIKWFTQADIQSQFGINIEAIMGAGGRYAPANMEALSNLGWPKLQRDMLFKQWSELKEIPQVPGSYYVERNINNAIRQVQYQGKNPRDALYTYNIEINKEIKRKRIEFGLQK